MLILTIRTLIFNFCIKIYGIFGYFIHTQTSLKNILKSLRYYEKVLQNTGAHIII